MKYVTIITWNINGPIKCWPTTASDTTEPRALLDLIADVTVKYVTIITRNINGPIKCFTNNSLWYNWTKSATWSYSWRQVKDGVTIITWNINGQIKCVTTNSLWYNWTKSTTWSYSWRHSEIWCYNNYLEYKWSNKVFHQQQPLIQLNQEHYLIL